MASKQTWVSASDGKKLSLYQWQPEQKQTIKAVLQISHGMAEHIKRYKDFAEFMNASGIIVYGHDHRGHGETAGDLDKVGYFSDDNGWDKVVSDIHAVTLTIKNKHPELPVFLLGHSMGSLLLRDYIGQFGKEIKGVLLSATAGDPGLLGKIGSLIAEIVIFSKGKKHRSSLLNQLSFGKFNQKFKPSRTDFDWLNRNAEEVDKYISDPYCGDIFMAGFYRDLLFGVKKINQQSWINQSPKDLPMLFFSGEMDPVGDFTKGVRSVIKKFNQAGIRDLNEKFYPDGRHEMLNELNREDVYQDLLEWIIRCCTTS